MFRNTIIKINTNAILLFESEGGINDHSLICKHYKYSLRLKILFNIVHTMDPEISIRYSFKKNIITIYLFREIAILKLSLFFFFWERVI